VTTAWTAAGGVTFTGAAATGGNTSVLNLAPTTLTYNVLKNGTAASQNLTLSETSGTGNAAYTGAITGTNGSSFSIGTGTGTGGSTGNGASGTVNSSSNISLPVSYTGSTSTDGSFTGTYTVTNSTPSTATQGTLVSNFSVNVGNATPDESGSGSFNGTVLSATVGSGSNGYANLASSSNNGVQAVNPTSGQPGIEGSTATILMGTNTIGTGTVSMTWRTRTLAETSTFDAVNNGPFTVNGTKTSGLPLISDVVDLYGMGTGSTQSSTTPIQTDPFAFEVSFNPKTLNNEGATGTQMASHGNLYLASLVGGSWENTIFADLSTFTTNSQTELATVNGQSIVVGDNALAAMNAGNGGKGFGIPVAYTSFATWASANGVTATNIGDYVGVWGVDTTNDEAWAVIEHNSQFAVVPEPSTIVLAGFGLLGGIVAMRRRRRLEA
jgi:hypothetical protein